MIFNQRHPGLDSFTRKSASHKNSEIFITSYGVTAESHRIDFNFDLFPKSNGFDDFGFHRDPEKKMAENLHEKINFNEQTKGGSPYHYGKNRRSFVDFLFYLFLKAGQTTTLGITSFWLRRDQIPN